MYIVSNRVSVAKGWEAEFEERFRKRAGQIEKQVGFVRMQILKPDAEDLPYVVLTTWENKAAFQGWIGSEDFKLAHQNPMPAEAFSGKSAMEKFEVIISAAVV